MRLFIACALMLGFEAITARADMFPQHDVHLMCADAEAIVLGSQIEGDQVRVLKWLKSPQGSELPPMQIDIARLGEHSREVHSRTRRVDASPPRKLETQRFVAFLVRVQGAWQAMFTIDEMGMCGSCGLIWIQDRACFHYRQAMNPGPYWLMPDNEEATEKELMAAISKGLRDAERWNEAFAIVDKPARARALAAYTLKSTSPVGDRITYIYRAREPLRELGKDAVPALVGQLSGATDEDTLDIVVLILYDIGRDARPAAPALLELLSEGQRASRSYVLSALGTTAGPEAIPAIEPFLKDPDRDVRLAAENAVWKLNGGEGK